MPRGRAAQPCGAAVRRGSAAWQRALRSPRPASARPELPPDRVAVARSQPPALSSFTGVLRELLETMDLQNGIRYGSQLQTAKLFVVALEQANRAAPALPPKHAPRPHCRQKRAPRAL
eukprot:7183978-Prymnesium_polylepis.1